MKFIKITSKGEIDERAFSLLGASSKRADNTKIGMFGSGLKYSLAFMLRKEIEFRVFAGYREIKFSTKDEDFRDKTFKRIYINDKETSLTTDMGVDWEHYFIIREIFCNALDESEASIDVIDEDNIESLKPIEDFTTFYIKVTEEFKIIIDNWDLYFSDKRKDILYHDTDFNQLYSGGENLIVYRKGIRCHFAENTKAIFNYDLSWIEINESRTIKSDYEFRYDLVGFLRKNEDKGIIHRIIYNINEFWERYLNWSDSSHISFSDTWLDVIGEKYLIPSENAGFWDEEVKELKAECIILPYSLIQALKLQFGDKIKIIGDDATADGKADKKIIDELSKREQVLLDESLKFLSDAGYEIKFPIKVCKFVKPTRLGQALDETIFLSDKVFTMGKREIINTIIEENQHLKTGYGDETRAMQTDLINLAITQMEERLGIYL